MQLKQKVLSFIDEHQDEMFSMLSDLIKINSENFVSHGNEKQCALAVKKIYQDFGLDTQYYYPDDVMKDNIDYLAGRSTDERPNVAGVYKGTGKGQGRGSVMIAAHLDTVEVGDEQMWTVPPLGGVIKDGRIYGRGSGDNKYGIVAGLFALEAIRKAGVELNRDVILSAYCDEEFGGGNDSIASCVKYPCDAYLSLDSPYGELMVVSVGGQALKTSLQTKQTQDSAALAIDGLNIVREELEKFGQRRRDEMGQNSYYAGTQMQESAYRISDYFCGKAGTDLSKGGMNFVFYTDKTKEQIYEELNAIEKTCTEKLDKLGIIYNGIEQVSRFFDYMTIDEDEDVVKIMSSSIEQIQGKPTKIAGACLSDYFLYLKHGSPKSISYGIIGDFKEYGGAHQPDEFITCKDFVDVTKAVSLFLLEWCGVTIK